ncbi:MAG: hypothetical protein MUQ75_02385 [Crocinitomicaceae bacterium]|nr:hypothetical protein [Crocinitomicaceae bacterium]
MTEDQRISVIAKAVENLKSITPSQSVEEFIAEIKTEQLVTEHGLLNAQEEDLMDESQFLFSDKAEEIEEEDQSIGLSDQMKGIYNDS